MYSFEQMLFSHIHEYIEKKKKKEQLYLLGE